jgi:mRNA-degrading endonuclease RelE of RelBE toxin-antitoxin system
MEGRTIVIEYSKRASHEVERLAGTKQGRQVDAAVQYRLLYSGGGAKKLRGRRGVRVLRCGEFRIVYMRNGGGVLILLIGKRNDGEVYKSARRACE